VAGNEQLIFVKSSMRCVIDSQSIKAPHAKIRGYDAGKKVVGRKRWPWVKQLFADGAYDRLQLTDKAAFHDFTVEIIRRSDTTKGFEVLPRRWVVERKFGWMISWLRLVEDYEQRIDVADAMIHIAMGSLMLRRNAHP